MSHVATCLPVESSSTAACSADAFFFASSAGVLGAVTAAVAVVVVAPALVEAPDAAAPAPAVAVAKGFAAAAAAGVVFVEVDSQVLRFALKQRRQPFLAYAIRAHESMQVVDARAAACEGIGETTVIPLNASTYLAQRGWLETARAPTG